MTTSEKILLVICLLLALAGAGLLMHEFGQHERALDRIEMKLKSPAK